MQVTNGILAELKTRLGLADPMVLVFYTRFTPVMSIRYDQLLGIAEDDLNWFKFRSMEEEWRYGHKLSGVC